MTHSKGWLEAERRSSGLAVGTTVVSSLVADF